jgi:hypothetical protein
MSRGKHATAAATRRDVTRVVSDLETHQRAVARLTVENNELRAQLDRQRTAHAQDLRALRAQVDEGASPQVAALEHELRRVRADRDAAVAHAKRTSDAHGDFFGKFAMNVAERLGVTRWEALEVMIGGRIMTEGAEEKFARTYGPEGLAALRAATGGSQKSSRTIGRPNRTKGAGQ